MARRMQMDRVMQLPVDIQFRGLSPRAQVEQSIRDLAGKLDEVYDRIVRCDVVVEAPHRHRRQGRTFEVKIRVTVPEGEIVVSQHPGRNPAHQDVHVAVRDSFQAARRQLEDHVRRHLLHHVKSHTEPAHGRVTFLDAEGAWGFLEAADDGRRVYFHCNSVLGGIGRLALGDEVRFEEEAGDSGPQASTVARVGDAGHHQMPGTR